MLRPDTPLREFKGIGEARAKLFASAGVFTAGDILGYFPRAYENRGNIATSDRAPEDQPCSLIVKITKNATENISRGGLVYVKATAEDAGGEVELVFFNQRWVSKALTKDRVFRAYGRVTRGLFSASMASPVIEPVYEGRTLPAIVPVYPLAKGLTQKIISSAVAQALPLCDGITDIIPDFLKTDRGLLGRGEAVRALHSAQDWDTLSRARRTLAFEELLVFRLALFGMRSLATSASAPSMDYKGSGIAKFFGSLPFSLTGAQERVIKEIFTDLCSGSPMVRLVQGDVGSGKTVLAAASVYFTIKNGLQAVLMAPTEILASQHYGTLEKFLSPFGITVALLTGSTPKKEKERVKAGLKSGEIQAAAGTHALFTEDVEYASLGLVVTDEQHRFGVMQRAGLVGKGEDKTEEGTVRPHTLVMSATPIPRTLSLVLYGDLEVSALDELPPGRQSINTYSVSGSYRERVYGFIKKEIAAGRQAYIICPLVEEGENSSKKAVNEYAASLREGAFKGISVGFVHGKMPAKEKTREMQAFVSGESKVLVSTTVVEVGVDVPNATVMLIENAESFGLSQLHQLRGRIGRGKHKSFCILMSDDMSGRAKERLDIMAKTQSGFEIAEADLKQRGPGDFFGERQSGDITFKHADIADMELIAETGRAADEIKAAGGPEQYPALKKAVERFFEKTGDGKTLN